MYNYDFLHGGDLQILGVFYVFLLTETGVVVYVSISRNIHHERLVFAV